jgi:hypothetical protein
MGKDGGGTWWPWLKGGPTTTIDGKVYKVQEHGGYWTSVIGNKSIEWLHRVAGEGAAREPDGSLTTPFVLTVASKAPHYAATPAPWYETGTWVDAEKIQAPLDEGVAAVIDLRCHFWRDFYHDRTERDEAE